MIKIKAEKVFYYLEILDEAKLSPLLPLATKLRQGNVFTHVCHSVHGGCLPHPLRADIPQADTPPVQTPQQTPPPRQTPSGRHPPPWRTPLAQCMLGYGQQAGGTHPTGMHSCFNNRHF